MRRRRRTHGTLPPLLRILPLALIVYVGALLPPILLMQNSRLLGPLWWVLLLLYAGALIYSLAWVLYRREMKYLRGQLGDEQFFARFPREKKREARLKKKQDRKNKTLL